MNGIVDVIDHECDFRILADILCPSRTRDVSSAQLDGATVLVDGKPGWNDAWVSLGVHGCDASEPLRREVFQFCWGKDGACHRVVPFHIIVGDEQ